MAPHSEQTPLRPSSRQRSRGWWLLAPLAVAAIVWVIWSAQHRPIKDARRGGPGGRSPTVSLTTVRTGDIKVYLDALGTVTPLATVTVRPRVDGQLMRVLFDEGQTVEAGALLAQIDPRPFEVQRQQAEGVLARDNAQLDSAKRDLERYQTLFTQDSIAKQQVDQQAALVKQYEAAAQSDQALINSAKLQLTYARVTAPISGRIGLRRVDGGNFVSAGDANGIAVIAQMKPITVLFSLPEDQLPVTLAAAQKSKPAVEAYDRAKKLLLGSGTLSVIDNQIDPTTGAIKLKALFTNADERLFPNQFVNVRVLLETRHGVTLIPRAALLQGSDGPYVYVAKPDATVSVRKVTPAIADDDVIAIDAGLNVGEQVVVDGVDKLRDGASVNVAKPASAAPVAAAPEGDASKHRHKPQ